MDPKHSHGPDRLDSQETSDLTEVHAAIQREHAEPTAEVTPIPLWLTAVCGVAICWAGIYLGLFHGGFRGDIFNERLSSPSLLFPEASQNLAVAPAKEPTLADQGKGIYSNNCVACHQANAKGVPGQFPPLAKSEWVNGSEKRFVAILLKGVHGPLTVEGVQINSEAMLPWEGVFNDKKIAALASFLRSNFDNNAPEISEAKVKAARAEFAGHKDKWTEPELLQIPADATLPDAAGAAPAAPAGQAPAPAAGAAAPAPAAASGVPAAPAADTAKLIAAGKATYMGLCVACHQPTGMGLFPVFPPLTKSPYVNGPAERLVAMVLKGNMGPMTIDGKPYNNVMPPQETVLTDDKIAAVTTFVRSTFGNSAPPVTEDVVAATRKKFLDRKTSWTQAELDAWK